MNDDLNIPGNGRKELDIYKIVDSEDINLKISLILLIVSRGKKIELDNTDIRTLELFKGYIKEK